MIVLARRATAWLFAPAFAWVAFGVAPSAAQSDFEASPAPAAATPSAPVPPVRTVNTRHAAHIGGKLVRYVATAGTILLYDAKNHPTASVFYHAYVAEGLGPTPRRPITFSYNGGPGGSSALVDIGAFGPRTLEIPSAEPLPPPPYAMVDNENSILDRTDLVFVDAVGTGYSRLAGHGTAKEYYGVDQDGKAFAQFIRRYITTNDRWNSPKYLLGESYGTTRSAVLANLLENAGISVSGVTLMSTVLDFKTIDGGGGDDEPYVSFLPTEAAIAAYYHKSANAPADIETYLRDMRAFAGGPYAQALIAGDAIAPADKQRIAALLAQYTGLPLDYILRSDLRVPPDRFQKELLGDQQETIGRYDARFRGFDLDPVGADADTDPSSNALFGGFTSAFNRYVRDDLHYKSDDEYVFLSGDVNRAWDWGRNGRTRPSSLEVVSDLASAMTTDRNLRVLSVNGIYDMATPFFATEQSLHHLGIAPELERNVSFKYYPSGHMIYVNPVAHVQLHDDLEAFYAGTSR